MIQIALGLDDLIARWVAERLPEVGDFGKCAAIGFFEGDQILCGVVYNNYRPHMIEGSIASTHPRWCSRATLYAIFAYPFLDLKVRRFQVTLAKKNKHAREFVRRLGFKYEGCMRQGVPSGGDAVVYSMLRKEADRWLERSTHE